MGHARIVWEKLLKVILIALKFPKRQNAFPGNH
jgi:hypothetical protein